MSEFDRVRWHCRRGLLELDLVLTRFLDLRYDQLDGKQRSAFETLLEYPDPELWDMIAGRSPCPDARLSGVLSELQEI